MRNFHFLIFIFLFSSNQIVFSQSYSDQHKKCSEVLEGVSVGDSAFWTKLQLRNKCLIGLKTPQFSIKTLDGKLINSDSLQGKVLVLNFWFTKCIPCIHEIPVLNKLVSKYSGKDIVFLSLANEDSAQLRNFLKSQKFNFEQVPNGARVMIDTFKMFSMWPTTIIIDKQGKIQFIKVGELENKKDHHKLLLDKLLIESVDKNQLGVNNDKGKIHRIQTSFQEIKQKMSEENDFTLVYFFKPFCQHSLQNLTKIEEIKKKHNFKVVLLTTEKENVENLNKAKFGFDTCYYFDPLVYNTHTLDYDEYDMFTKEVFDDAKIIEPSKRIKFPAVFVFNRNKKLVYFNDDEDSTEIEFEKIIHLKN